MALFKTVYSSSAQELGADGLGLASLPAEPVGGLFEKRGGFGRCCGRCLELISVGNLDQIPKKCLGGAADDVSDTYLLES